MSKPIVLAPEDIQVLAIELTASGIRKAAQAILLGQLITASVDHHYFGDQVRDHIDELTQPPAPPAR